MALATKCPHCNTVFRVAHDQLKLRGGIVRCGSCNQVFDGNAALLEPLAPPPPPPAIQTSVPLDQSMAALDTRAAEMLSAEQAEPMLELDSSFEQPVDAADDVDVVDAAALDTPVAAFTPPPVPESANTAPEAAPELPLAQQLAPTLEADIPHEEPAPPVAQQPAPMPEAEVPADESSYSAPPFPLPAEPAVLPPATEAVFDLDLGLEAEPEQAAADSALDQILSADTLSDDELEAALEAELAAMEQTLADIPHDTDGQPAADDIAAGGRREPTWDEPSADEPQAGAGPGVSAAFAAAADAVFSAEEQDMTIPVPARPSARDDELDEVDEEALVQLSSAGLAEAETARAHAYLHGDADAVPEEEPGFVKRERQRQKYGKAATIGMSLGSLLLVAALGVQAVTTFRNTLAAGMPALKPALTATCKTLGCKIELPTQIDDITIEQGELQTLSDTAFSFTTLLRNQSATAQTWPSIELVLDDDKDKHLLRRVFTPRDYLGAEVALDKGFAPHTEQAVKLYFELRELKASGYHIAVFYP